jgi:hypothetical protein
MTTEFNDRPAHDRPLNDRFSDVPEFDEPRVDDKAVINDDLDDDKAVVDEDVYDDKAVVDEDHDDVQEPVVPQQNNRTHLFEDEETERFRAQWQEVQARFVDEPQSAVREADSLLSSMMDELKSHIDSQKQSLDGEWDRDTKDTEELRVAMQRYRSLFNQILSV